MTPEQKSDVRDAILAVERLESVIDQLQDELEAAVDRAERAESAVEDLRERIAELEAESKS